MPPSVKTFLHKSVLRLPPIGYPVAVNRDYEQVIPTVEEMYNNAGDAFSKRGTCNLDRHEDERILIHRVCDMWGVDKERYWGYTTSGGSEGNLEGLWMAREKYPDGVVYYSDQAHYSIKKMTKILRLPTVVIPSDSTGAIDVRALAKSMKSGPAIILANLGTTFLGGIDDVKSIRDLCGPDAYIHADAAFLGFTLKHQFPGYDGYKYADSISVSSHKWPGVPFPGGVFICIADNVSYIENFEEVISQRDVTVSGSRNGHTAIFLNHFFNTIDLKADVESCVHVAEYLKMRLEESVPECVPYSNDRIPIVTFNRPDDTTIRKWSLATVGLRSHVVCMPHVTKEVVDAFVHDLSVYFERRS